MKLASPTYSMSYTKLYFSLLFSIFSLFYPTFSPGATCRPDHDIINSYTYRWTFKTPFIYGMYDNFTIKNIVFPKHLQTCQISLSGSLGYTSVQ